MRYESDTRERHGTHGTHERDDAVDRDTVYQEAADRDRPGPGTGAEDDPLAQRPGPTDQVAQPYGHRTTAQHDGRRVADEPTDEPTDQWPADETAGQRTVAEPAAEADRLDPANWAGTDRTGEAGTDRTGEAGTDRTGEAGTDRTDRGDQNGRAGNGRATGIDEPAELRPGEAEQAPQMAEFAIWEQSAVDGYRERWRRVQVQFLDDPKAAAEEAESLLADVLDVLSGNLTARKRDLDDWRSGERRDTEELRIAVRGYRDLLDKVLTLA